MPNSNTGFNEDTDDDLQLDTKSRILQAAVKVFATRGYDAATIREITQMVDLSHGLIRYHFKSKDTLWRAAIRFTFTRAVKAMRLTEAESASLSSREQVELEIRKAVTYYGQHPEHVRIVLQEIMADGERLQWIVENFSGQMVNDAIARTQEHMDAGCFRQIDPVNHYYAISSASRMMFVMAPEVQRVLGIDPTTPEAIERHVQAITSLLLRDED